MMEGVEQCPTAAVGTDTSPFLENRASSLVSPSPQTHGQTRHRPRRLDSTRPSLPRVAVSPVVLTAPLQQTNNSAHRLHPPVPACGLTMDAFTPDPLALIGHRRRWPRNMDTSLSVRPFLPEQGSTNFLGFAISLGVWDSPPPWTSDAVFSGRAEMTGLEFFLGGGVWGGGH